MKKRQKTSKKHVFLAKKRQKTSKKRVFLIKIDKNGYLLILLKKLKKLIKN